MRVLTMIHLYPPHHVGGYEVACRGVMERFAERGHEVLVLTSDTSIPGTGEELPTAGIEIRRNFRLWFDSEAFEPLRPNLPQRVAIERVNQHAVRQAIADLRPDVASVWSLGYCSWSMATILEHHRIPLVLTLLDDWPVFAFVFDGWTRLFERRPWARPVSSLLGLVSRLPSFEGAVVNMASQMIADSIAAHGRWKFPGARVVPLGVDTREVPILEPPSQSWSWRLVYVGRVVPNKGVGTLIRALTHLPDQARLTIIGHGSDSELHLMRRLASEVGAGGRVEFTRVARTELAERIRQADVLVFPSEWPEPFGIVPLEAMASGVPVVATGTGGSAEFLEDGDNCVLFPPGDAAALAQAVHRLHDDDGLRRRVIHGGTRTARRLTMDRYADELERLHEIALRGGQG